MESQDLFEFLANYCSAFSWVEFSVAYIGIGGNKSKNYITTGHIDGSEPAMSHLIEKQLEFGYTIRLTDHCHPLSEYASNNDIKFAKSIFKVSPKIKTRIFHIPTKKYIDYNKDTESPK